MKCKKAKQLMWLYRDNELNSKNRKDIQEHLNSCESCKKEYQQVIAYEKHRTNFKKVLHENPLSINIDLDDQITNMIPAANKVKLRVHLHKTLRIAALFCILLSAIHLFNEQQQFRKHQLALAEKQIRSAPTSMPEHFHNTCIEESKDVLLETFTDERYRQLLSTAQLPNLNPKELNQLSGKLCQQVGMFLSTSDKQQQRRSVAMFIKSEWGIDLNFE